MYGRAVALICLFALTSGSSAFAQPTPLPTVTADSESWYLNGEPLLHDGNVYYPRGAAVFFNRNEYVRTGFYRGIPLYSRRTIEPYSMVFVPLAGGLMQPYERPRTGELVGTIGSFGPTLTTPVPSDERREMTVAQAPGPPTSLPGPTDIEGNPRLVGVPVVAAEAPRPVGTSGAATESPVAVATTGRTVVLPRPRPLVTAARPTGVNGLFIEYDNIRWFVSGPTVEFDAAAFRRVGDYGEFPVYVRAGDDGAIYIPTGTNIRGVVARYARR